MPLEIDGCLNPTFEREQGSSSSSSRRNRTLSQNSCCCNIHHRDNIKSGDYRKLSIAICAVFAFSLLLFIWNIVLWHHIGILRNHVTNLAGALPSRDSWRNRNWQRDVIESSADGVPRNFDSNNIPFKTKFLRSKKENTRLIAKKRQDEVDKLTTKTGKIIPKSEPGKLSRQRSQKFRGPQSNMKQRYKRIRMNELRRRNRKNRYKPERKNG